MLISLGVGDSAAHTIQVLTDGPLRVLLIVVVAFAVSRLVGRASNRLVRSLRHVSPLVRTTERAADRAQTLAGVIASILRAFIWIIAGLTILGELGIKLAPFVATATVVGAAVGFGAQTLVKDFLSGLLILAEDQYGVGDNVTIVSSKTTGTVESVNLRTTRIRSLDGIVWYVPNGDIRAVGNNTEGDSQALVDLVVPHGTDLAEAGRLADEAASGLVAEDLWKTQVSGPPTFGGVTDEDHQGITLRVGVATKPGQDAPVARQIRLRILEAWRTAGITAWDDGPVPVPALVGAQHHGGAAEDGLAADGAAGPTGPPTPRASVEPPRGVGAPAPKS
ncbi:MAG: mechanosensitive ion channel family protein [Actinomycetota bacterium]|nr:mechanosensitive ion channel family protein [Actinomycetota bacterium]